MSDTSPKEAESLNHVADAAGTFFEHLGYRSVVGKVWAALILSRDPLDSRALIDILEISTGALSMSLKDLVELGLVYRETKDEDRRYYYRAENDLLVITSRVFRGRERKKLVTVLEKLKLAESALAVEDESQLSEEEAFRLVQVRRLIELGEFVIDVVDAVMDRTKVELKAARKWISVSGKFGGESLSKIRQAINATRSRRNK